MIVRNFFPHFSNKHSESSGLESKEGVVVSDTSGLEYIVTDEALSVKCKLNYLVVKLVVAVELVVQEANNIPSSALVMWSAPINVTIAHVVCIISVPSSTLAHMVSIMSVLQACQPSLLLD